MGGVFPGILLSTLFIVYIGVRCWLSPELGPAPAVEMLQTYTIGVKIRSLKKIILPILLIICVLGSIYAGIATPTEAAGLGSVGAIICAFAYRRLTWKNFSDSIYETAKITAMILWITIGARCFVSVFSAVGGDELIREFVIGLHINRWFIMILFS